MSEKLNKCRILNNHRNISKRILLTLSLIAASTPALALECDTTAARSVKMMMQEFATVKAEGDHIAVHWSYAIEKQPRTKRLQMTTTYADTDACLTGVAREIHFYRKKKLVGIASPASGIRLID